MKAAYGANISLQEWNRKGWTYHAKGEFPDIAFVNTGLRSVKRHMDTANAFITSYDDPFRFYQLKLSIIKSRYRVIVHHDDSGK